MPYFWKKDGGKPSGPGALGGLKLNTEALISWTETGFKREASWLEILSG